MKKIKVISGCQTGADEGGLHAASIWDIETGGTMPKGWKTQTGPRPDLAQIYGLEESKSEKYPPRTKKNVKDSDVTILFGDMNSSGCKLTIKYCKELNKPYLVIPYYKAFDLESEEVDDAVNSIKDFLQTLKPSVINVAGNRESSNKGIYKFTSLIMAIALHDYKDMLDSVFE